MPRYHITIEYDGGDFVGWQRQDNGTSIQGVLEAAASAIIGGRDQVLMQGSGRTDAGVHATGQAAHFDLPNAFEVERLPLALNAHLPATVRVLNAREVAEDFNARFDALRRCYHYRILTRRIGSALRRDRVWHISAELDLAVMQKAALCLIGKHDFTSFRAQHCQAKSPVRTLDILRIESVEDGVLIIAEARSFLHHQVRNITGTLVEVGRGKYTPDDVCAIRDARNRRAAGPTAPAHGLYLTRVDYD